MLVDQPTVLHRRHGKDRGQNGVRPGGSDTVSRHRVQEAATDRGAFLVGGEEGGFLQAGPEGFAFDAYFVGRHHW